MKFAFFVGEFPSISETFILSQITGLIDRGHKVDVYGQPSKDDRVHEDVRTYELMERVYHVPSIPDSYVKRAVKGTELLGRLAMIDTRVLKMLDVNRYGRLATSLRLLFASVPHLTRSDRPRYDVAHCHFGQNGLAALALREAGILRADRVLTTFHGHDVYVDVPRFSSRVQRILFEKGDGFTVNSAYTAENVVALGGKRSDIRKLPVGLDVETFSYRSREREEGEPVHILTVGRLVEKKGITYAIRALARLKEEVAFEYRIVGGGPLRESLEQTAHRLGVAEHITFLGTCSQNEVREQYRWAHLFTLPSITAEDGDREGQGLVLQEAQACGLPVVATRHNGFPDGVLEGDSAVLVPERDVDALSEALADLMQDETAWKKMGKAGRAFVEEKYDIEVLNDRLVDIYRSL